jgi:D-3-phosphoglycerate dehydrogenase
MTGQRTVLVIGEIHRAGLDLLEAAPGVSLVEIEETRASVEAAIAAAEAIIVRTLVIDAGLIARAPRLKLVARHGVGYDNVDVAALTARGIPLALVGDANSLTVAEHTLYLMLAVAKRGIVRDRAVREGSWHGGAGGLGFDLSGRTVLVVGLGRIGTRVARLCGAFGMTVLANDPYVTDETFAEFGATRVATLGEGLQRADVVTMHTPLNDETRHLIAAAELGAMPAHAILLNTSRGGVVDEAALAEALAAGGIAGAGLDVFAAEPPPPGNPLLARDDVVLSPHFAGFTGECWERMAVRCAQNVLDAFAGRLDPAVVVNPEVMAPA